MTTSLITHTGTGDGSGRSYLTGSPSEMARFNSWIEKLMTRVQELETVFRSLYDLTNIDGMGGVNLDTLGEIVGEKRNGKSDPAYRLAIKNRIALNHSNGTHEDVLSALRIMFGLSTLVFLKDNHDMTMEATVNRLLTADEIAAINGGDVPRPAGTRFSGIIAWNSTTGFFGFHDSGQYAGGFHDSANPQPFAELYREL